MKIAKALFILIATLTGTHALAATYELNGRITGVNSAGTNNTKCYIKIDDPKSIPYSNKYHSISNEDICILARTAYFLRTPVITTAQVDWRAANYANDIIELSVQD